MTQTEFELQENQSVPLPERIVEEDQTPSMIKFLVERGWVKDSKQAEYILIGISILFLLTAFGITFGWNRKSDYVTFPDGTKITITEYLNGLKSGKYR